MTKQRNYMKLKRLERWEHNSAHNVSCVVYLVYSVRKQPTGFKAGYKCTLAGLQRTINSRQSVIIAFIIIINQQIV